MDRPVVTGTTRVGSTLRVRVPALTPGAHLTYRWQRAGQTIPRATAATYRLTKADRGARISVVVRATRAGAAAITRTSAATAPVR